MEFVRKLSPEEREKPIWEILGTTFDVFYLGDRDALMPFLELPQMRTTYPSPSSG